MKDFKSVTTFRTTDGTVVKQSLPEFTMHHPTVVSRPIRLSNLTYAEKENLEKISKLARETFSDRYCDAFKQVNDMMKQGTDAQILVFTTCSCCGTPMKAIKNNWLLRFTSGTSTYIVFCDNSKCEFYLKSIPYLIKGASELTANGRIIEQTDS